MNSAKLLLLLLAAAQLGLVVLFCVSHRRQELKSADDARPNFPFVVKEGLLKFAKSPDEIFKQVGPYGYVEYSIPAGSVNLGEIQVPVSLNLDSCLEGSFSPFLPFPGNWWCPLFQSLAIPGSEDTISVDMVDGQSFWLIRRRNSRNEYESEDGQWLGKKTGDDEFTIVNTSDVAFVYRGGLLRKVKTGKYEFDWVYNEVGEVHIKNARDGTQLAALINAQSTEGRGKKLIIGSEASLILLSNRSGNPGDVSISGVKLASGQSYSIQSSKHLNMESTSIEMNNGTSLTLEWDANSGLVKKVGEWDYAVTNEPDGSLKIVRTNSQAGKSENLVCKENGRIIQVDKMDGTAIIATKSMASGPQYGKPVRIEELRDKRRKTIFSAIYKPDGTLARSWDPDNGELVYKYDEQKRANEIEKNGRPFIRRTFDGRGRLTTFEDEEKHIEYKLAYLDGGEARLSTKTEKGDKEEVVSADSTVVNELNADIGSKLISSELMLCNAN